MNKMARHVLSVREGGLATITLNRPEARNALSDAMKAQLLAAVQECERDEAVRCVLIRAAGDHFMAGGDVKGFHAALAADRAAYAAAFEQRVIEVHQIVYSLRRMAKPVLVAAQGGVAGFGMSLLMAADFAIVADDAFFTLAYRNIGLSPDGCATYLLPRLIGERRAMELMLLGERFDAGRALDMGLVNRVVPRPKLEVEAGHLAAALAAGPTRALALGKRLIRSGWDASWDEQSHREAEAMALAAATDDHLEGVAAFVAKRPPVFSGR
jgi:2-(1,2-epoxy-1,2-dihydrophenyl)acetyl-CoA isomerase